MKRKFVFFMLLIVFLLFETGCEEKKEYGSWDGNYVYVANYRIKTDGTGKEEFLSSFSDGKNEYQITEDSILDISFYGDVALLSVRYTNAEEDTAAEEEMTSSFPQQSKALLLCDLKKRTYKHLLSTNASDGYCTSFFTHLFYDDFFVVGRKSSDDKTHYMTVDFLGNILCDDDEIYQNQVIGDHVFRVLDRHLAFCTLNDRTYVTLFPVETDRVYVTHLYGNLYRCNKILFDPVKEKYCDLPNSTNLNLITLGDYFVTMVYNSDNLYEKVNIYKIKEDCSYELELNFPANLYVKYPTSINYDEKYIRFDCKRYSNDASTTYTYKKETKTLYKGTASVKGDINDKWGATDGVCCGKYYYNVRGKSRYFGIESFSFIRYDSETKESVYMDVKELMFSSNHYPPSKKFTVKNY